MKINFFCPYWGSDHLTNEDFLNKVKEAGYYGVEYAVNSQASEKSLDEFWNLAEQKNIKILLQHYDTYDSDFSKHIKNYTNWFAKIKSYPCVKINSQTGKDYFTYEQNSELIKVASTFAKETGTIVLHETHRNKFSFAAHIVKEYLQKLPDLKITLDISHWVCVAESMLDDQTDAVDLAITRADHIHARVGHPEGPQISDPRAPEFQEIVEQHLIWWQKVIAFRKNYGYSEMTITPEFGPVPYMPALPFTNQPVTSQWDVNLYMKKLLEERL